MVKISELVNDWSVTGTEQVPLNDWWTTKKATTQDIADIANIPSSQVTDFDTAVDARIDILNDTAKTTPVDTDVFALWDTIRKKVTWANIKATLKTYFDTLYHTKNALRTWLTANKMLVTDWSGNEWYIDTIASSSDAEFHQGTSTSKNPTVAQIWLYLSVIAWTNLFVSADTERTTASASYTKLKEIEIEKTGTYTVEFDIKHSWAGTSTNWRIYKNGVAFWTEQLVVGTTYGTKTENLSFAKDDLLQLYIKNTTSGTAYCRNLRIKWAVSINATGLPWSYVWTVNTD